VGLTNRSLDANTPRNDFFQKWREEKKLELLATADMSRAQRTNEQHANYSKLSVKQRFANSTTKWKINSHYVTALETLNKETFRNQKDIKVLNLRKSQ